MADNFGEYLEKELCAGVIDYAAGVFDKMQWPPAIAKYPFQPGGFTITRLEPKIMVSGSDEFRPLSGLDDGVYTFATFDILCRHPFDMPPWDNNSLRRAGGTLAGFVQNVWSELCGFGGAVGPTCNCAHDCCGCWFDRYIDCSFTGHYNADTGRRDGTSDQYFCFIVEHAKARNF